MRTAEQHNSNDDYANVQYSMYDSNDRIIRILDMMAATVILILAALIAYKPLASAASPDSQPSPGHFWQSKKITSPTLKTPGPREKRTGLL